MSRPGLLASFRAILVLWMMLLCGVGCREEGKADDDGAQGIESPSVEAWAVPVAEVPRLLSGNVRAIAVDGAGALWFGGDGVSWYDPRSGAWATFTGHLPYSAPAGDAARVRYGAR
jgi:hypothetical protein